MRNQQLQEPHGHHEPKQHQLGRTSGGVQRLRRQWALRARCSGGGDYGSARHAQQGGLEGLKLYGMVGVPGAREEGEWSGLPASCLPAAAQAATRCQPAATLYLLPRWSR